MADGFIVRKGGVTTEQALAPTITEVSTTATSITFTITNNDASTAVILYEVGDTTPDANSIELAAAATSGNLTVTGLSVGEHDVYATANVTGKVKSNVTELTIEIVPIVYTAATGGTTAEYDDGGSRYKSHTFTSDGTFTVTTVGDATGDRNKVDYLIIAGGGSGGSGNGFDPGGGGGGAGGYRTTLGTSGANSSAESKIVVTAQGYTVTIGAGGGARTANTRVGFSGNASSALGVSTVGGGGGGSAINNAQNGGSGGGAGAGSERGTGTSNEGFDGGARNSQLNSGAGGGGAGQAGTGLTAFNQGTAGGNGLANTLRDGTSETRAGGGGGAGNTAAGAGGSGGGGAASEQGTATSGTANTGSGGGGIAFNTTATGAGGSGIVVIRYEIAPSV